MAKPILYSYFRSSSAYRVRIALNWKKIDYDYKGVNLLKGEQVGEEHLAINPMGEVPALMIDNVLMTQSVSIMEYLDETRTDYSILPKDHKQRALVRQITEIIASGIQPVQNLRVLKKHGLEHKLEWGSWAITHGFNALEQVLLKTAGKYCVGDEVTMADMCLVPQVYNAARFKIDMSLYPTIDRVNKALLELPEVQAACPGKQPDCPPELKDEAANKTGSS